jgi:glycerate-2-kinase
LVDFLKDYPHVSIICSATDGRDGNSDACGAIIDATTSQKAIEVGISSELFINNFDSNSYFKITNNLITTGLTNNNLLDIIIILIDKKGEKNG